MANPVPSAGAVADPAGEPLALLTPYPRVDLDVMEANLRRMQAYADAHGIALRPHVKTHKLPHVALWQIALGAVGVTCQKLSEAEVMAAAGVGDILVSYNLLGERRLRGLAALRRRCHVAVVADSLTVIEGLAWAAALPVSGERERGEGTGGPGPLPVLIDGDAGHYGRTGVATPDEAVALAREVAARPGLRFGGLFVYPNLPATGAWLREALRGLAAAGLKADVVSSGGTPGAFVAHETPEVTEYRVGTYVYYDRMMVARGVATLADCALRVAAQVVSVHRPARVVLDAGSKALTSDLLRTGDVAAGYGWVVEYPEARIHTLSEEHGHVDWSGCARLPAVGETVTIIPNHVCPVVNLYDRIAFYRGERLVEVVPVAARGCSQ